MLAVPGVKRLRDAHLPFVKCIMGSSIFLLRIIQLRDIHIKKLNLSFVSIYSLSSHRN